MLVKSERPEDHLAHLEIAFNIMRAYGMKLNPSKCTFGVGGGKLLGYMVSSRGIEANPEKIEAILQLKSPSSVKEVQKLTGKIASLNRFISRSADRNLQFSKVLRKPKDFRWTNECELAFKEFKNYLKSPPLLANPKVGDAVSENAVSLVLIREEKRVHNPVYYVSKMLQGAERRYTMIEKLVLALVITARRLRPYFQSHQVVVLIDQPLKTILSRPKVSGRLVKWAIELGEYDIDYQARTAKKGQILADFMIELTGEPTQKLDTWMLHVDGSSNAHNGGAGILIQGPGVEIEVVVRLSLPTTNNEAEYEALILGLDLAYEAGAKVLEVYTDSQLIAMQIEGSYEIKEKTMALYHRRAKMLMQQLDKCSIQQISRCENDQADSVSKFGALLTRIKDRKVKVLIKEQPAINEVVEINTVESTCPWIEELAKYHRDGILPDDQARARKLKFRAPKFTLVGSQLYKRSIEGPLLKCLDDNQAKYVMSEVHEGSCGNHFGARSLAQKLTR
ncbi:UNVERIFIED_CONTAM: hypothetical protein Sindi_2633600 [Sesamum indicum]